MKFILTSILLSVALALAGSSPAFSQGKTKAAGEKSPKGKAGKESDLDDNESASSTKFDFDEALLEGKMKAPAGMMLKGRVEQSKTQMVHLRQNWRSELKKAPSAVRAIKPRD